jgi:hypothetical protein
VRIPIAGATDSTSGGTTRQNEISGGEGSSFLGVFLDLWEEGTSRRTLSAVERPPLVAVGVGGAGRELFFGGGAITSESPWGDPEARVSSILASS